MTDTKDFFHNVTARNYTCQTDTSVSPTLFHSQLPNFKPTPLVQVPKNFFGLDNIYIKDESIRLGLPSFKILGASWGTFRTIAKSFGLPLDTDLAAVRTVAQRQKLHLVTATDGNHGRAIARMAQLLGIDATIFVPSTVNEYTRGLIKTEGAEVVVEQDDYDAAVLNAYRYAQESSTRLCIQDTSFSGYHEIPAWIVQGYGTMFREIEDQLAASGSKATHILTPVGVGSLAHSAVAHSKANERRITVIAVESEMAACLQSSLRSGSSVPVQTEMTIMDGINCGTVSEISWPILKDGIDAAVTISDIESHQMVVRLTKIGVDAGPCGASTAAAFQKLLSMSGAKEELGMVEDSVIVLLNTEGPRQYEIPQ